MNKSIPSDGKQSRESQSYVPTGPLFQISYKLKCSESKARSIAKHYGSVSQTDDGIKQYMADGYYYRCPAGKGTIRKWHKERSLVKKDSGWKVKIYVVSDEEGHRMLYEEFKQYKSWEYFASHGKHSFSPRKNESEVIAITTRPPITKKLGPKERRILKSKQKLEAVKAVAVE